MPAAKKKTVKVKKCLTCRNKYFSRGLCQTCLAAARGAITRGETTEHDLIERGLMEPRKKGGRRPNSGFAKAFSDKK